MVRNKKPTFAKRKSLARFFSNRFRRKASRHMTGWHQALSWHAKWQSYQDANWKFRQWRMTAPDKPYGSIGQAAHAAKKHYTKYRWFNKRQKRFWDPKH